MPAFGPKPRHGTYELDRSHPLARGLVALFPLTEGAGVVTHDIVHGIPGRLVNASWRSGLHGPEVLCTSAAGGHIDVGTDARLNFNDKITVAVWYHLVPGLAINGSMQLVARDDETDGRGYTFSNINISGAYFYCQGAGGCAEARASVANDDRIAVAYHDPDSTLTIMTINGSGSFIAAAAENAPIHTTGPVYFGRRSYSGFEENLNGSIKMVAMWRNMTRPELFALNPYGLLRSKTP